MENSKCGECGMMISDNEYHPYAACLMFIGCQDSEIVTANLDAVQNHGYQLAIDEKPEESIDFCIFCGQKVMQDKWREHMNVVHKAVVHESPFDENGLWKLSVEKPKKRIDKLKTSI